MPRYTQPRKTWVYTQDFKVKAVKLIYQDGIQVKQVAEALHKHETLGQALLEKR